tara:strand:+ start:226 stop:510 length:285 start_codon:yes stop_codon:yes gene_type:complete
MDLKKMHLKSIKDVMKNIIPNDFVKDTAIQVLDRFVEHGYVPDCTDTDDQDEWTFQDEIQEALEKALEKLGYTVHLDTREIDLMKKEQLNPNQV